MAIWVGPTQIWLTVNFAPPPENFHSGAQIMDIHKLSCKLTKHLNSCYGNRLAAGLNNAIIH